MLSQDVASSLEQEKNTKTERGMIRRGLFIIMFFLSFMNAFD